MEMSVFLLLLIFQYHMNKKQKSANYGGKMAVQQSIHPSILFLSSCLMLHLFHLQLIISSIPPCYLSLADVHSQASLNASSGFTRSPQWLQSNMHGPAGRRPMLITFRHNFQMTALKLDCKHGSIACWYNPGKSKQITYTYAYIKKTVVAEVLHPLLTCNYMRGEWEGHLDSDGLCQENRELVTWYKSHGLKTQPLRLPQGIFIDVSPFMTLLQPMDTDVWLAKEEQGVCREGGGVWFEKLPCVSTTCTIC